ncbi:MAG: membrane protein insertase YidC [Gammaproteobacteria bacterium]|nr:membrane protein insertase YidC [Gammaproteobacteria bacterium]MBT8133233.1 membrane protein insertase YidC [Gammaproteobacteria bacterium]NNJ49325.1 membrane protein insertase YidC [Gammaproteobacteria bacterium]
MGNHRLLLYFTLFFIIYMIWAQWQLAYGPKSEPVAESTTLEKAASEDAAVPQAASLPTEEASVSADDKDDVTGSQRIKVITDVLDIEIDSKGGDILRTVLRDYSVTAENPEEKLVLMTDENINYYVAQSGLVSANKGTAPSHNAVYRSEQNSYRLAEGTDIIEVPLYWEGEDGTKIKKVLTFKRGDYVIDVKYYITAGGKDWSGSDYMQIVRSRPVETGGNAFIHTYTGGVVYNDEIKYEKYDFDDILEEDLNYQLKDGWLAMIQHYFLAAWIPDTGKDNYYFSRYNRGKDHYTIGTRTSATTIEAGQTGEITSRLVVGPKLQNKLEEIAPGLDLTVDYGILTIFAKPLFWLLDAFYQLFGNWGWAIIFLTITVKAVFYKLSEMSYRSMAKMRKVAPRIQKMKEQYGDDRQAMSKAMMDMYKREKINPMGGCFPILVQMPVFISLYWVLLESVEMRHAPFVLWLTNLTDKDPYFVLPVLMGVSMYIQQKLNPAPIDPIQQKVFQIMPFAFTIMFAFFPSGLVLYWVVNNILSIAQQYVITKRIENA